jgi:hypothetical protein
MTDDNPDPLAYVTDALELLPEDPAQTTIDDLGRVAAITQGVARHALQVRAEMAELTQRALDSIGDPAELAAIADELAPLDALYQRAQLAEQRFTTYAADALAAHGFNLDQLMAEA